MSFCVVQQEKTKSGLFTGDILEHVSRGRIELRQETKKQLLGRLPPPVRCASSHYQLLQQKTPQMNHILALPLHFIEIKHSKGMEMRTIHSTVILLKVLILMGKEPHPCGDKGT